jgi:hypothetical protein
MDNGRTVQAQDFPQADSLAADSLARLLAARQPRFSLDQFFYNSPQMFHRDIERVCLWHRLFAGPSRGISDGISASLKGSRCNATKLSRNSAPVRTL